MEHQCTDSGACICVKCNTKIAHKSGNPCRKQLCPNCGQPMLKENNYHHKLYLKIKGGNENENESSSTNTEQ